MGRVVRVLLVLGLLVVASLSGWQIWSLERARTAQRADFDRLQTTGARTRHAMLDARAAQRAYVSPGQSVTYWKPIVDRHLTQVRDDLQELKAAASPATAAADDAALEALGEVTRLERRIAEHAGAGRLDHASDLLYADGVRASLALEQAVHAALGSHRADLVAQRRDFWRRDLLVLGLSATLGFLAALLLTARRMVAPRADTADEPVSGIRTPVPASAVVDPQPGAAPASSRTTSWLTRSTQDNTGQATATPAGAHATTYTPSSHAAASSGASSARASTAAAGAAVPAANAWTAASGTTAPGTTASGTTASGTAASGTATSGTAPAPATLDALMAAADLSTAIARVGDAAGLQPLLAGLTQQLDAIGLIVWLEDADGHSLTPAMSHGYPAQTMAAVPPIDRGADNATARAFRNAESQIVDGSHARPGAIVIPMQTAAGCVGVLAAELRHGREHDPATLAIARILAAQLAMLTGPAPESRG